MTPFPHLKEASQEAGGNPGVWKFKKKLSMNLKETFFWDTLYENRTLENFESCSYL